MYGNTRQILGKNEFYNYSIYVPKDYVAARESRTNEKNCDHPKTVSHFVCLSTRLGSQRESADQQWSQQQLPQRCRSTQRLWPCQLRLALWEELGFFICFAMLSLLSFCCGSLCGGVAARENLADTCSATGARIDQNISLGIGITNYFFCGR